VANIVLVMLCAVMHYFCEIGPLNFIAWREYVPDAYPWELTVSC
jgi:hypothetical protein